MPGPALTAALPSIIGAGGNIIGGLLGMGGQRDANASNLQIARENRRFQERMSSTAYQRAAKDLDAAGLNRILALGSPSSTPAGNIATMQNIKQPLQKGISEGISSAISARNMVQQIKESEARVKVHEADVFLKNAQTGTTTQQGNLAFANTQKAVEETAKINTEAKRATLELTIRHMQIPGIESEEQFYNWLLNSDNNLLYQKLKKAAPIIKDYAQAVGTITGAFNLRNILGGKKGSGRIKTETSKFGPSGEYRGGSVTTRE